MVWCQYQLSLTWFGANIRTLIMLFYQLKRLVPISGFIYRLVRYQLKLHGLVPLFYQLHLKHSGLIMVVLSTSRKRDKKLPLCRQNINSTLKTWNDYVATINSEYIYNVGQNIFVLSTSSTTVMATAI